MPERHQTLRATINWSHSLLTEQEQQLFLRLAAFSGGFTLEAVEAVCYENEDDGFLAIDEIESLMDKGLVEKLDGDRFNLLQTIKDFAMERLKAVDRENTIFQTHAEYYFEVAQFVNLGTQGVEQIQRMQQAALEETNMQAALDYLLKKANEGNEKARETGLNLCGELWMYWHIRGKHQTAKNYINLFFGATENQSSSLGKCKALFNLQVATFTLGEFDETKAAAERHFDMATSLGVDLEIAKSYFSLAFGCFVYDLEEAKKYSDQSVARFRKLKNDYWLGFSLWQNGLINLVRGQLTCAKDAYAESLTLFKKIKDKEGEGCAQSGLAMLDFIAGKYDLAIEKYKSALSAFESVGDRPEEARVLSEMSWTYLASRNTIAARHYTLESIQAHKEVGSARGIGLSMNGLAAIEAVEGRSRRAVEIAAAAEVFAKQEGIVIEFGANNHGKIYLDNTKKKMSALEIENAENTGRSLSLKDLLEMAKNDVIQIP
jgi:tetratricopeptide (TPR) repeat protein